MPHKDIAASKHDLETRRGMPGNLLAGAELKIQKGLPLASLAGRHRDLRLAARTIRGQSPAFAASMHNNLERRIEPRAKRPVSPFAPPTLNKEMRRSSSRTELTSRRIRYRDDFSRSPSGSARGRRQRRQPLYSPDTEHSDLRHLE
jgi:hypothetical protein